MLIIAEHISGPSLAEDFTDSSPVSSIVSAAKGFRRWYFVPWNLHEWRDSAFASLPEIYIKLLENSGSVERCVPRLIGVTDFSGLQKIRGREDGEGGGRPGSEKWVEAWPNPCPASERSVEKWGRFHGNGPFTQVDSSGPKTPRLNLFIIRA